MSEKAKNFHQNHRARVRETYRKTGIDAIPDHNLLEFLLFYSVPRKDTNELAHRLIDAFGSLNGVFNASYDALLAIDGMGESSALLISSVPGICRRYVEGSHSQKVNLPDPEAAKEYIINKCYGRKNEVFYMLCLDAVGGLINCCMLGEGNAGTVVLDKRTVLETAIRNNADKIIFAHNHPNGIAAPSKKDLNMTSEFVSVFSSVGIRLADHIIVAGAEAVSLVSIPKFANIFLF